MIRNLIEGKTYFGSGCLVVLDEKSAVINISDRRNLKVSRQSQGSFLLLIIVLSLIHTLRSNMIIYCKIRLIAIQNIL